MEASETTDTDTKKESTFELSETESVFLATVTGINRRLDKIGTTVLTIEYLVAAGVIAFALFALKGKLNG